MLTLKEVGCKACFVDRAIRHELEPQLVGGAVDVVWLLITAETAEQRAALRAAIPHLHVIVGAAAVELNLRGVGKGGGVHTIKQNKCGTLS